MHDHVAGQFVNEGFAASLVGVGLRAIDAMRQFDDADGREGVFYVAAGRLDALDDLLDRFSAPFSREQDVGVEDQAQGLNPIPIYPGACDCG